LGVGKFQTGDGNHCFAKRENNVGKELPVNAGFKAQRRLALNPNDHHKRKSGNKKPDSDFAQRGERKTLSIADKSRNSRLE